MSCSIKVRKSNEVDLIIFFYCHFILCERIEILNENERLVHNERKKKTDINIQNKEMCLSINHFASIIFVEDNECVFI